MTPQRLHSLLSLPSAHVDVRGRTYAIRTQEDRRRKPVLELDEADFLRLSEGLSFRRTSEGQLHLQKGEAIAPRRRSASVSPLTGLMQQAGQDGLPLLKKRHLLAANQWRTDYESAYAPVHMTTNWSAFGSGSSGSRGVADPQLWRIKARARYQGARAALSDLAELLVKVCLEDMAISAAERLLRLPRRTGRDRICEGLERLARHYRL